MKKPRGPTVDMSAPDAPKPLEVGGEATVEIPMPLYQKLQAIGEVVDALVVLVGTTQVLATLNAIRAQKAAK